MKSHTFRVPASTSNLGAGFDALSLALNHYLTVSVREAAEFDIQVTGVSVDRIPTGADNLVLRVAQHVAGERAWKLPPFSMKMDNQIPLARGLGSSAAAIIAGITCYELMTEDRLSDDALFQFAMEFEPHPDNLAAGLYGGLISAAVSSTGAVFAAKLTIARGITPLVVIPDFELSTQKARAVLAQQYSREDAVYNIQRSALIVASLTTGRWSLLREAMRDRIHQPYRAPLIPGLAEILALEAPGLLGIALSGAGPTVLAFAEEDQADSIGEAVTRIFQQNGVRATPLKLEVDTKGRFIL
jgi:homoserine kinase